MESKANRSETCGGGIVDSYKGMYTVSRLLSMAIDEG